SGDPADLRHRQPAPEAPAEHGPGSGEGGARARPGPHRHGHQRARPAVDLPRVGPVDEGPRLGRPARRHDTPRGHLMTATTSPTEDRIAAMVRQHEVEQFLYDEAALLDAHRYEDWLALFAEDATYFVPIRRTRMRRELNHEFTRRG